MKQHYTGIGINEVKHRAAMCPCTLKRGDDGVVRLYQCHRHAQALVARDALEKFVSTIEATGGVHSTRHGGGPVGEPDWLDLGDAYHAACAALGRKPKVTRSAP